MKIQSSVTTINFIVSLVSIYQWNIFHSKWSHFTTSYRKIRILSISIRHFVDLFIQLILRKNDDVSYICLYWKPWTNRDRKMINYNVKKLICPYYYYYSFNQKTKLNFIHYFVPNKYKKYCLHFNIDLIFASKLINPYIVKFERSNIGGCVRKTFASDYTLHKRTHTSCYKSSKVSRYLRAIVYTHKYANCLRIIQDR